MPKIITILFFSLLSLSAFSQELKISNGKKQKTIKIGTPLDVIISGANTTYVTGNCCQNYSKLEGVIKSIESDSIVFAVNKFQHFKTIDQLSFSDHYYTHDPTETGEKKVAIANIASITKYKSLRARKRKGFVQGLGAVFIVTGLMTTLNVFLVKEGNSQRNILISGLSQVGLGLSLGISGGVSKQYNFISKQDPWVIQK